MVDKEEPNRRAEIDRPRLFRELECVPVERPHHGPHTNTPAVCGKNPLRHFAPRSFETPAYSTGKAQMRRCVEILSFSLFRRVDIVEECRIKPWLL